MHVFGTAGLLSMFGGLLTLVLTVWLKLARDVDMTGNPLLLLSVVLGLVGVQFISMGLIGEMLTRTYHESQGKSAYQVRTTLNLDPTVRPPGGVIHEPGGGIPFSDASKKRSGRHASPKRR